MSSIVRNLILGLGSLALLVVVDSWSPTGKLLAQKGKGKAAAGSSKSNSAAGKKMREKNIIREKTYKGEKTKVDFEAIDISGERKTPFGTMIDQTKANKDFDLIPIRYKWHDEMVQSTSSLETGRNR